MKNKKIIFIIFGFIIIFLLFELKFLNRQIIENDEGIYWATFLQVNKGYSLYKEISFSQLPGFFLAIYPTFKLFGSTIAAARFGVLFWSILALFSIVWLGQKRKNQLFSLVSIVLLISIPTYFNQSITLQSDIIAVAFSTISFALMMTSLDSRLPFDFAQGKRGNDTGNALFLKNNKIILLLLSALFFSFAMVTKFDYSLVLPFGFILLVQNKNKVLNIFLFVISSILIILVTLNFFGFSFVVNSVLILREKALVAYPFEPFKIFEYLKKDILLFALILVNILFGILNRKKDNIFFAYFLWFISNLLLVLSFRPLFQHHLVFLAVPSALLLALNLFNMNASINRLIEIKVIILLIIAVFAFDNNVLQLAKRQNSKSIKEREIAKNFILENTESNEVIISDEAALYGMTGRLPPPELVDLSYVQSKSENISTEKFESAIKKYKPRMIVAWNGRLNEIKKFENIIGNYSELFFLGKKRIFIHKK